MIKQIKLPRVAQAEVMGYMHDSNISRLHLGKDALPYLYYKTMFQLGKAGASKFLTLRTINIIEAYSIATRKQRREFKCFRELYLLTIRSLLLSLETEKLQISLMDLNTRLFRASQN